MLAVIFSTHRSSWKTKGIGQSHSRSLDEKVAFSAMDAVNCGKTVRKVVTAHCGKMQTVTTLCRFQFGAAEVRTVPSDVALFRVL